MIPFDPEPMLASLNRYGVKFVLIGGLAGNVLGSASITNALDICHARDNPNLERLASALQELGAKLRGTPEDDLGFILDAKTLEMGDHFAFITADGPFDILGTPKGSTGFDQLNTNATTEILYGLQVRVVALNDLMRMKKSAGRNKDLIELEVLGALRDEIEGQDK